MALPMLLHREDSATFCDTGLGAEEKVIASFCLEELCSHGKMMYPWKKGMFALRCFIVVSKEIPPVGNLWGGGVEGIQGDPRPKGRYPFFWWS